MYVTYENLFRFGLLITVLIGLVIGISRKDKKINRPEPEKPENARNVLRGFPAFSDRKPENTGEMCRKSCQNF